VSQSDRYPRPPLESRGDRLFVRFVIAAALIVIAVQLLHVFP
jgi:hypothetical protein